MLADVEGVEGPLRGHAVRLAAAAFLQREAGQPQVGLVGTHQRLDQVLLDFDGGRLTVLAVLDPLLEPRRGEVGQLVLDGRRLQANLQRPCLVADGMARVGQHYP